MPGIVPPIGAMDQWLAWQINGVPPATAASLTAATVGSARIATAITSDPHAFDSGDEVLVAGADQALFNGRAIVTVIDQYTLTYRVSPGTPDVATGAITIAYYGDGMGGQRDAWTTKATIAAEVRAISGDERIAAMAVTADVLYHVRMWRCAITPADRLLWEGITLYPINVLRDGDSLYLDLDCAEGRPVAAA